MDRSRLKTTIILILALLNLCLLFSLLSRSNAQRESREQAAQQLSALFQADGIRLSPEAIPHQVPPPGQSLSRDRELEERLISVFLGEHFSITDQGGGIFTYGSHAGAARCGSNGSFDILGTVIQSDAEAFFRRFCREYHYKKLSASLDESGSGTLEAVRFFEGLPVFNCTVTFTVESDAITKVRGTLLPEHASDLPQEFEALSALAALTTFLDLRRESGAFVSEISAVDLAYELQDSSSSSLTLTPAWCIRTDTNSYYVNCYTGSVTPG